MPIATSFKGILLDAYGVFWAGNRMGLFPGSEKTMEKLVLSGKIVGILSNTSQLASSEIEKLAKHGLIQGVHYHFLLTSGEIARQMFLNDSFPFLTPKKQYWQFSEDHPEHKINAALFEGSKFQKTDQLEEADFIYASIPHIQGKDQIDPEVFRDEVVRIRPFNLPMVCVNPDRFVLDGNPPKMFVRQGSIAAMYEELGGSVFYVGKPSLCAFQAAMERFNQHGIHAPSDVLMVGDTPETDIRGAKRYGMHSALMTQTGIFAEQLKELAPSDAPHYYVERLGDVSASS